MAGIPTGMARLLLTGLTWRRDDRGPLVRTLLATALLLVTASCGGGAAEPAAGAAFCGQIETGAAAAGGVLCFGISDDGTAVTELEVGLVQATCDGLGLGMSTDHFNGTLTPISDGQFDTATPALLTAGGYGSQGVLSSAGSSMSSGPEGATAFQDYQLQSPADAFAAADLDTTGHLEGRFTSPEQAEGTITLHIWVIGTDATCELGTFPWSASQQPTGG